MSDFQPFQEFREKLFGSSKMGMAPPVVGVGAAGDDVLNYLRQRYANIEVTQSFVDDAGQHVDCVPIGQQPSLQGGAPIASPPAFEEMAGTSPPRMPARPVAGLAESRKDRFGNQAYCPPGFVPVVRVTPERIQKTGGLAAFFQKAPGGGRHPSFGAARRKVITRTTSLVGGVAMPVQNVGGALHAYAHAAQDVSQEQCIGARTWMNVWTPDPTPGVFALSQLWISGQGPSGVQTIEGGWHVYPAFHDETSLIARLFIFWTPDGYQSGNYNLANQPGQPGFIQTDNTWVIGGALNASVTGGDQQGFLMQWQRDPANGNWWLYLQGSDQPVAVGYYPASNYSGGPVATAAEHVDFGGEVCSQQGSTQTGQMGSGQPASGGWQQSAFHKEIAYLTSGGWQTATLAPMQDAPEYTIDLHNNGSSAWGTFFFFGGAGGIF